MASPLVSRAPRCLSCIRRMTSLGDALQYPASQQIRGKKKLAKATTIKVKLRANIAGFGKKGSIVPIPPGVMRNTWFPRKMAEYQTLAQLKELGDVAIERDSTYGGPQEKERLAKAKRDTERKDARKTAAPETPAVTIEPAVPLEDPASIESEKLGPEQAAVILKRLLPSYIEFYRTPMAVQPPPKKLSPSLASTSAVSAAAAAAAAENTKRTPQQPKMTGIYGSVSTADVAANLKAILGEDREGMRVILSPENISFMEEQEAKDRIKYLGTFGVNIKLGPSETVQTTIKVMAQN